jgi:RHS repeat-associated protein
VTASQFGGQPIYGFTGAEIDRETDLGLIRMGARWYAARLGRWSSVDLMFVEQPDKNTGSILEAGAYGYSLNNPLRFVDESGLNAQARKRRKQEPKKPPWNERQLASWLREELEAIASKIDKCDTWYQTRSYCKNKCQFEIQNAKGKFRLGMQVSRLAASGHDEPRVGSPVWEALENPDERKPRELLDRAFSVGRSQMFGVSSEWHDGAGSGEGSREAGGRHADKLAKNPYYRAVYGVPHQADAEFADKMEAAVIDKEEIPIPEPPSVNASPGGG